MMNDFFSRLHSVIDAGRRMVDDATASIAPELFDLMTYPEREPGDEIPLIEAGTRINWNGILKKAAVDLWDLEINNPDNAPTLWVDLLYRYGHRIIPDVIPVTLSFYKGETGWEGDVLYRSKKDNNVYPPSVRPDDWEVYDDSL